MGRLRIIKNCEKDEEYNWEKSKEQTLKIIEQIEKNDIIK